MRNVPRRRLSLEMLEDRLVPATFGLTWSDATHLSLSYAPDGVPAGTPPIVINYNLNAQTTGIQATLYNAAGQTLFSLNATQGQTTTTGNVTLPAGPCYLNVVDNVGNATPPTSVLYDVEPDGIGVEPLDPFNPPTDPLGNGPHNPYATTNPNPGAVPTYSTLSPVYVNPWM